MLRVNLRRELEATRNALVSETEWKENEHLTSAMLDELGIETQYTHQRRLQERRHFLQDTYTEDQVRHLCIKYRLRCLPVDLFKGELDVEVPQKKQAFETDYRRLMQQDVEEKEYRIVAPGEMFHLASVNLDPLLLYKFRVNDTDRYKLVHQWGGDMSGWRAIVNYPLRSIRHLVASSLLLWSAIIVALILTMGGTNISAALTLIGLLLTGGIFFTVSFFSADNGNYQTSDRLWNSEQEF